MPVMPNSFIYNAGRLGSSDDAAVANIIDGGQYGFGNHLPYIDAATPLVLRSLVPVITHVPTMFQYVDRMADVVKALIERQSTHIDGVDLQYTLEESSVPAGQDGQNLSVPTNARRLQPNPTITIPEVNGMLVWNTFKTWMNMIKDPDTQASSLAGYLPDGTLIDPQVMSFYSMDMLLIQYDQTMQPQNIIDAYFVTNMWPSDIGTAGFVKNIGESTRPDRTISFRGVVQHNRNTKAVGQSIANLLQLHRINYDFATPIATQIESQISDEGLQYEVQQIMSTFGPLGGNQAISAQD